MNIITGRTYRCSGDGVKQRCIQWSVVFRQRVTAIIDDQFRDWLELKWLRKAIQTVLADNLDQLVTASLPAEQRGSSALSSLILITIVCNKNISFRQTLNTWRCRLTLLLLLLLSERTPLEHCCVHNMSPFLLSSGLSPGSREANVQKAKVCLNCMEPSVALLVASSRAVLVGYTLQRLNGGPREVNCEQYG